MSWLLAVRVFPNQYSGWPEAQYWGIALATSLLFFLCILAHELGHSLVAMRNGIQVKSITLFIFGGVAQISREAPRPLTEGIIAIAGPLVSVALGSAFLGLHYISRGGSEATSALFLYLGEINISVAVFNMLPGFPLDGGRVFRAIAWGISGSYAGATRVAAGLGKAIGYLLIVSGLAFGIWTGNIINGLWLAFIGWFLSSAASQSSQQVAIREALRDLHVRDIMFSDPPMIPRWMDLRTLVNNYFSLTGRRCFLVGDDGHWDGLVSVTDIKKVPQEKWASTMVGDVMVPMNRVSTVRPEEDVVRAMEVMEAAEISQVPVVENGWVIGLLAKDRVVHLLRTRQELSRDA